MSAAATAPARRLRILAATDLSERSGWAVERALHVASASDAELLVLHVTDPNAPPAIADALQKAAHELVARQLASASSASRTQPEVRVASGRSLDVLVSTAAALPADLIVIGRHEKHAALDLFRGSTGERLLRLARSPVLVVGAPPAGSGEHYKKVLVALDFSMPSRLALECAARWFQRAEFHVLHAWETPSGGLLTDEMPRFRRLIRDQLDEYLAGLPKGLPPLHPSMREAAPTVAIRASVEAIGADLLVLGTHGRTGVVRSLIGSVTEDILKDPPSDVLAVGGW